MLAVDKYFYNSYTSTHERKVPLYYSFFSERGIFTILISDIRYQPSFSGTA